MPPPRWKIEIALARVLFANRWLPAIPPTSKITRLVPRIGCSVSRFIGTLAVDYLEARVNAGWMGGKTED
jgi:hypothetical protein